MKKSVAIFILILTIAGFFSFFALPHLAGAQEFTAKAPSWTGLVPCGRNSGANGETQVCTLCHLIVGFQRLIQYALYIVIAFAFAGIFFAGIMYVISSGDEGMITKAKSFLSASFIGFAVVLGAWIIVNTTLWLIGSKYTDGLQAQTWWRFSCSTQSSAGTGGATTNPSNPAVDALNKPCDQISGMSTECVSSCASYNKIPAICGSTGQVCCKQGNPAQDCVGKGGLCRIKYNDGTGGCLNTDLKKEMQMTEYTCPQSQVCCFENLGFGQVGPLIIDPKTGLPITNPAGAVDPVTGKPIATPTLKSVAQGGDCNASSQCSSGDDSCVKVDTAGKYAITDGSSDWGYCMPKTVVGSEATAVTPPAEPAPVEEPPIAQSQCQLVAGDPSGEFAFVIGRTNQYNGSISPCYNGETFSWGADKESEDSSFKESVTNIAGDFQYIPSSVKNSFVLYRMDETFDSVNDFHQTAENNCPELAGKKNVYYGHVINGTGDGAYAHVASTNAFFCSDDNDLKKYGGKVWAHEEIGHVFGGLGDEYSYSGKFNSWDSRFGYNCTKDSKCNKWQEIESGCYQGCLVNARDFYRSSENSIMNENYMEGVQFSALQKYIIEYRVNNFSNMPSNLKESGGGLGSLLGF